MTSPQDPVEPWLAPDASPISAPVRPATAARGMPPRLPMLIGLITFVVTLVLLSVTAAVSLTVGDQVARNVELRQLVTRIEASEAQMSEVQAQEAAAVASYRDGTLSQEQLDDELRAIARRGAVNIAAAGERVAAVEWARWHREIQSAQLAYLAHNEAWTAYLTRAADDPGEFAREQAEINDTFAAAQAPLEDAVPSWDMFRLKERIAAIFEPPADATDGPTESA